GIERVIDPAPLASVTQDPRVLEGLEVERQARLAGLEGVGEIAHALLAAAEPLDDLQARGISQRVKQLGGPLEVGRGCRHGSIMNKYFLISQAARPVQQLLALLLPDRVALEGESQDARRLGNVGFVLDGRLADG